MEPIIGFYMETFSTASYGIFQESRIINTKTLNGSHKLAR